MSERPRETVHHPPEHLASDLPTKPLHDVPSDPALPPESPPNAASEKPRELPNGVLWC
jgi:hypothetical protein